MKNYIIAVISTCLSVSGLLAQTVITYETHALKVGTNNPMNICNYESPGEAGENVTWDFSDIGNIRSFNGLIIDPSLSSNGASFSNANIELSEFDSRFFFSGNEKQIEQYGYSSGNGKVKIHYDNTFVKMKYPFVYGDSYSGTYSGSYEFSGIQKGTVNGEYTVSADGYGNLILPGNTVYENALRIKTEKTYVNDFGSSSQEAKITTYRWYIQTHRYPALVLTEVETNSGLKSSTSYQAAYNNNVVQSISVVSAGSFQVFPNPVVSGKLFLQFESASAGNLSVNIYDTSGQLVRSFTQAITSAGMQEFDISNEITGLKPSTYSLVVFDDQARFTEQITITHQ